MKILYLHQYFVTPAMGGGVRSYEMGRRLVSMGHEVEVITTDQTGGAKGLWRQSTESGIDVNWANISYDNKMSFVRRIVAFVAFAVLATLKALTANADVIYATSTPLTIAIPALIVSTVRRIPFVFEVRDMWPDVPIALGAIRNPVVIWLARRLEAVTYRRAAHIVTLAPGMKDDIVARGASESKVSVITQGCDLEFFKSEGGVSPRSEFPWLGSRKLVLYAGTIGIANGVDYLVRLASEVAKIDPEVRFAVIGAGKQKEAIVAEAAILGTLNNNLFFLEKRPKRELVQWFLTTDVHIALFTGPRAIWKDAAQNKFFDAMASGKPIANNFVGWQSQLAEKEGIGVIIDPQDTAKAARQLVDALHNERWMASVPAKAKALAVGKFNRDNLAAQLENLLAAVVQKTP